mgnify:CR=1 FL=1
MSVEPAVTPMMQKLNARVLGSGSQTLVLAHGFVCDQRIWQKLLPQLQSLPLKLVLFDYAGCGGSPIGEAAIADYPDLHAYVEDLLALLAELIGFARLAVDDLDDHVARLQHVRFLFPKAIGLAAAIDAQAAPAAGELLEAAADLLGTDRAFAELDAPADAGAVGCARAGGGTMDRWASASARSPPNSRAA